MWINGFIGNKCLVFFLPLQSKFTITSDLCLKNNTECRAGLKESTRWINTISPSLNLGLLLLLQMKDPLMPPQTMATIRVGCPLVPPTACDRRGEGAGVGVGVGGGLLCFELQLQQQNAIFSLHPIRALPSEARLHAQGRLDSRFLFVNQVSRLSSARGVDSFDSHTDLEFTSLHAAASQSRFKCDYYNLIVSGVM